MSDLLSDREQQKVGAKLRISSPVKKYRSRQDVDESQIALSIEVPYYLLKEWHGKVDKSDPEASGPNYISLVNELIPGHCTQINQGFGERINSNLAKKAGSVKSLYKNAKNSRERNQLDRKTLKINIFEHELVSMEGIEDDRMCTRQEIEEWRRKVEDLESKKKELVKEMHGALKEKDEQLKGQDEEIA